MAKKSENFITIPKDFQSLHDLKDLVDNYEVLSKLANALNGYQKLYVDSYLKTFYELKTYLPKGSEDIYTVWIGPFQKTQWPTYLSSFEPLVKEEDKDKKLFLVDTKNKAIHIFGKLNIDHRYSDSKHSMSYDKILYEVDLEKRKLLVILHFSYTDSYPVGGCMISTGVPGGGYLTGHSYVDYIRNGYDVHEFCTRTNKYLGCKKRVQDKAKGWEKLNKRY